jgi:RNA 2',3'-cyclic 3'-phosphodiesterase
MPRLFVAAWPPPEVVEVIERQVPRPPRPGVRWVPPENWHVTLRFLGRADPEEAASALGSLVAEPAMAEVGPAVAALGRSVVCLPVAGLDALAAAVRTATAGVGEPADPRPFTGHLTLARGRGGRGLPSLGVPAEASFAVGEVLLVRSETRPDGAVYHPVGRWSLGRC